MYSLRKHWWLVSLLLVVGVALLSPLASPHPDGLERVAEDQGFIGRAKDLPYKVISDYIFPGIGDEGLATIVAGIVGIVVIFALVYGMAWILRHRSEQTIS